MVLSHVRMTAAMHRHNVGVNECASIVGLWERTNGKS